MYSFPYYKENDYQIIFDFMQKYPFAFLSGCDESGSPVATQVPMLIEERDGAIIISGHIMRQTDHYKAFEKRPEVLAVFTGPNSYVSSTWYSDKDKGSTWNYMSVHARGKIKFLQEDNLVNLMKKFTIHFEENNVASTAIFDNLSAAYKMPLLNYIGGFEIEVEKLETVFKLSQDRDEKSYLNIIKKLSEK